MHTYHIHTNNKIYNNKNDNLNGNTTKIGICLTLVGITLNRTKISKTIIYLKEIVSVFELT